MKAGQRRARLGAVAVSTIVTVVAAAIGFAGASGTYALLQDQAKSPAATVTAGSLDIQIDGKQQSTLGRWELSPRDPVARSFAVTNTGDVLASLSAVGVVSASAPIAAYTRTRITPVAAPSDCRIGLGGMQKAIDGSSVELDLIAPKQTKYYCLELSLQPQTPVSLSGSGISFTLTVNAAQK